MSERSASRLLVMDRETGKVRIAYVPVESEGATLRENMAEFITEFRMNLCEDDRPYMDKVKNEMEENNYYVQDLINIVGDIRRKAVRDLDSGEVVL